MCNHHGVVDAPVCVSRPGVHDKQLSPQVVPVPTPAEAGVQPACRTCSIPLSTHVSGNLILFGMHFGLSGIGL